jgi:DNA repair protein RecO (recombination protein O)
MACASYLCELVDMTTEVEHPVPQLFEALREALTGLERQPQIVVRRFELTLFEALGQAPRLTKCAKCGQRLAGEVFFAARAGGAFCAECARSVSAKFSVDAASLRALRQLCRGEEPEGGQDESQLRQWERISAALLKEVFGVWPRSRQFIREP